LCPAPLLGFGVATRAIALQVLISTFAKALVVKTLASNEIRIDQAISLRRSSNALRSPTGKAVVHPLIRHLLFKLMEARHGLVDLIALVTH
jgi:hypothetical protein